MRVLIVEDEAKLAGIVRRGLLAHGFAADIAGTGEEAVCMASASSYDLVVLDVMLPDASGLEVCRELRAGGNPVPVLILTALSAVDDRVQGLDSGADDYLAKPFEFAELVARLRALARRSDLTRDVVIEAGGLRLDPAARTVHRAGTQIELTAKEFSLLEAMMRRPGQVISRFDLLESAWDESYENKSNVIDVYMGYLRAKVDRPFGTQTIETARGAGYRLVDGAR